jgi:hypothetical protein
MKQLMNFVKRKNLWVILLSFTLIFAACKKNDVVNESPTSGLMAFNLIPEDDGVDFVMSNRVITNSPLTFTNYSGTYLSVFSSNRSIALYSTRNDSAFAEVSQVFEPKKYYSIFALGANGKYSALLVNDHLDEIPDSTGDAFVRYINAIPDSVKPTVGISLGETSLVNDNNAGFGTVSSFKETNPGEATIKVTDQGNVLTSRTITLEKGKVYTILLVGNPAATDDVYKVQIKFIVNGMVS